MVGRRCHGGGYLIRYKSQVSDLNSRVGKRAEFNQDVKCEIASCR